MGSDPLSLLIKWSALLVGVLLIVWAGWRQVRKGIEAEVKRKAAQGVSDAQDSFQKAEREARDLPRDKLVARLRRRARRRSP